MAKKLHVWRKIAHWDLKRHISDVEKRDGEVSSGSSVVLEDDTLESEVGDAKVEDEWWKEKWSVLFPTGVVHTQ